MEMLLNRNVELNIPISIKPDLQDGILSRLVEKFDAIEIAFHVGTAPVPWQLPSYVTPD
jgi:hypothetical protein